MRSPAGAPVSGLGKMEKVPEGSNHLWSYRHAGEINMKHRVITALSEVSYFSFFFLSVWPKGPADLQRTLPTWLFSAAASSSWLDLGPDLHWLCVVLLKAISLPNVIQHVKRRLRGMFLSLVFLPHHEIDISHHLLPLAISLELLLLTHSATFTHPLLIPRLVFTIDKQTLQSLFFSPPSAVDCDELQTHVFQNHKCSKTTKLVCIFFPPQRLLVHLKQCIIMDLKAGSDRPRSGDSEMASISL